MIVPSAQTYSLSLLMSASPYTKRKNGTRRASNKSDNEPTSPVYKFYFFFHGLFSPFLQYLVFNTRLVCCYGRRRAALHYSAAAADVPLFSLAIVGITPMIYISGHDLGIRSLQSLGSNRSSLIERMKWIVKIKPAHHRSCQSPQSINKGEATEQHLPFGRFTLPFGAHVVRTHPVPLVSRFYLFIYTYTLFFEIVSDKARRSAVHSSPAERIAALQSIQYPSLCFYLIMIVALFSLFLFPFLDFSLLATLCVMQMSRPD